MKLETLRRAMVDAHTFLERAKEFEKELFEHEKKERLYWLSSPKKSGSVRRSSMELTRTLADLRQGR